MASAFVLNPPYSAAGNGMIFVEKALGMMNVKDTQPSLLFKGHLATVRQLITTAES